MSDTMSRGYFMTFPRYIDKHEYKYSLKYIYEQLKEYSYFIVTYELAPTTQSKHFHVWLEHCKPVRFSSLLKKLPFGDIQVRKGKKIDCFNYVTKLTKDDDHVNLHGYWEFGERPRLENITGKRNDIESFKLAIYDGYSDYELLESFPSQYFKYNRLITEVRQSLYQEQAKKMRDVKVTYIYGDTGSGKTFSIYDKYDVDDIFKISSYDNGAFDSYRNQKVLVLEEYRSGFKLSYLLQILDNYPLQLSARYNNRWALFEEVYIVSNINVSEQYPYTDEDSLNAFYRRIDTIIHYYNDYIFTRVRGVDGYSSIKNPLFDKKKDDVVNYDFDLFELPF